MYFVNSFTFQCFILSYLSHFFNKQDSLLCGYFNAGCCMAYFLQDFCSFSFFSFRYTPQCWALVIALCPGIAPGGAGRTRWDGMIKLWITMSANTLPALCIDAFCCEIKDWFSFIRFRFRVFGRSLLTSLNSTRSIFSWHAL